MNSNETTNNPLQFHLYPIWQHRTCSLFWEQICAGVLSFVYICIAVGDPVIKKGELTLTGLTLLHVCACPSQNQDFQRHMSWSFFFCVFNELMWEVIVRFVDVSGIVDHHGKNFLLICQGIKMLTRFDMNATCPEFTKP